MQTAVNPGPLAFFCPSRLIRKLNLPKNGRKKWSFDPKKKAFQIFYQDASVLAKLARQIHLEKPDPLISAAK